MNDRTRCFPLDPGWTYLNHASFGLATSELLSAAAEQRQRIERQPHAYLTEELPGQVDAAAAVAADLLGARHGRIALVPNVTVGVNAVLHSLPLHEGSVVVTTDQEYVSLLRALRDLCGRAGATLQVLRGRDPDTLVEQLGAVRGRIDVLYVSHIVSARALLLPVRELAAVARERGAVVIVDGAHAPGHLHLDVQALGIDCYVANLHKWLPVPRPLGVLWVAPSLPWEVRPSVVSLYWDDESLARRFSWMGTGDPTPLTLLAGAVATYRRWLEDGAVGEAERLAEHAVELMEALGLRSTGSAAQRAPRLVAWEMPCADPGALEAMFRRERVQVWTGADGEGRCILRLSTHVYNNEADMQRVATVLQSSGLLGGEPHAAARSADS